MTTSKNLLRSEYDAMGGPKLTDNMSRFLDKLWALLLEKKEATLHEVMIATGFDEDGDEDMFLPLCDRFATAGLLGAYTKLTSDAARTKQIGGSLKAGVCHLDIYNENDLTRMGLADVDSVFVAVTLRLSEKMQVALAQANSESAAAAEKLSAPVQTLPATERPAAPAVVASEPPVAAAAAGEASDSSADEADGTGDPDSGDNGDAAQEGGPTEAAAGPVKATKSKKEPKPPKVPAVKKPPVPEGREPREPLDRAKTTQETIGSLDVLGAVDHAEVAAVGTVDEYSVAESTGAYSSLGGEEAMEGEGGRSLPSPMSGLSKPEAASASGSVTSATAVPLPASASRGDGKVVAPSAAADFAEADTASVPVASAKSGLKKTFDPTKEKLKGRSRTSGLGMVIGKTRAFFRRLVLVTVGTAIAVAVLYMAVRRGDEIAESTKKIEAHYETPTNDLKLVKRTELDALKEKMAALVAQNEALQRENKNAIDAQVADTIKKEGEASKVREEEAYNRGKQDAIGLSLSTRERVALLTLNKAVINGECDAFGRGNRVDQVHPINLPVDVLYWLVDPSTLRLSGVVATNAELLTRADGPVTQVRCLVGRSDIWPSFGEPQVAADGQARPLDKDGKAEETNPLLQ